MRVSSARLLTRLARLESRRVFVEHRDTVRFGHLKRLPPEYQGERHVIVARQLPNVGNQEWVEFEEVPGPDPNPPQRAARAGQAIARCFDVMFVQAYPRPEGATGA
jgi:hypothetical protein